MFGSESDMTDIVVRWMQAQDLTVRAEFISPWGVCDLVGLSFNERKVAHRLRLGQRMPITTICRAAVLLRIPDIETGDSISVTELAELWNNVIPLQTIMLEAQRLMNDGFLVSHYGRLQKKNGWMPLHRRLVAVELKLTRVEEAIQQAENNLGFTNESYLALPLDLAVRTWNRGSRKAELRQKGLGLLGVTKFKCEELLRPKIRCAATFPIVQFQCVEKFWRERPKVS